MPKTRHRISGVVEDNTPQHVIDHPVLGKYLEVIDEHDKALVPELIPANVERAAKIAADSKASPQRDTDKDG